MLTAIEEHWKGFPGESYTKRNPITAEALQAREVLWAEILKYVQPLPQSILEVGANLGLNLRALQKLAPARLYAAEPNDQARWQLVSDKVVTHRDCSPCFAENLDFPSAVAGLVFTSGVLIHIRRERLRPAMTEMFRCSRRYIVCIEYFRPAVTPLPYRGELDRLWAADYGSMWQEWFPLEHVAHGFAWKPATGL